MKKIFAFAFMLMLCVFGTLGFMTGCNNKNVATIDVYVPDGAPLIAVAPLLNQSVEGVDGYELKLELIKGAAIAPSLEAKKADIAFAPVNICAKYADDYVYLGTVLNGLNHIVSRQSISGLSDMRGEIIYAFQKNGTPGLSLKALINLSGLEYKEFTETDKTRDENKINIEYMADPSTVRNALKFGYGGASKDEFKFGLLAEPILTEFLNESEGEFTRLDLVSLWKERSEGRSYPQVGAIVKRDFLAQNPKLFKKLQSAIERSVNFGIDNPAETARIALEIFESKELASKEVTTQFISQTGQNGILKFVSGNNAKSEIDFYYNEIAKLVGGASAFGGSAPLDSFYVYE